ncbi:MAG: cytochrome c biogenesis protein CcsA [Micavibrio sp.]|nr:cytochrome c biogenesis protein CcsA [Micavibrio sp.]
MRIFLFLLSLFCLLPSSYAAGISTENLRAIPVLHEGRVKPLESMARAVKKKLRSNDSQAMRWFTITLFDPAAAEQIPVFKIRNPDVANMLELPEQDEKLYSFQTLSAAIIAKSDILESIVVTPQDEWTKAQIALIDLSDNISLYKDILSSLTLFLPLNIDNEEASKAQSFVELTSQIPKIKTRVQDTLNKKGEQIDLYSEAEQRDLQVAFSLDLMAKGGERSSFLRILPTSNAEMKSPWAVFLAKQDEAYADIFEHLQTLTYAYHMQDFVSFNIAARELEQSLLQAQNNDFKQGALEAELFYNALSPFKIAFFLYAIAMILLVSGYMMPRLKPTFMVFTLLTLGACVQAIGLSLRMYILERPPVSTLYESIMFVGLIASIAMLVAFIKDRQLFWLYLTAGLGMALQLVGFSHDTSGDNLMMLSAVLNTNFWLATHVICITAAYAFCLIAAALAHFTLILPFDRDLNAKLKVLAIISLLLATTGTVLGGIWADQSWGRFWGWDPKENGALLICLWLIWVLHGPLSGMMSRRAFQAGLAYTGVIVALSWFGVNLLSVGLHSYGFTNSAATILALFVGGESILIGALWVRARKVSP